MGEIRGKDHWNDVANKNNIRSNTTVGTIAAAGTAQSHMYLALSTSNHHIDKDTLYHGKILSHMFNILYCINPTL